METTTTVKIERAREKACIMSLHAKVMMSSGTCKRKPEHKQLHVYVCAKTTTLNPQENRIDRPMYIRELTRVADNSAWKLWASRKVKVESFHLPGLQSTSDYTKSTSRYKILASWAIIWKIKIGTCSLKARLSLTKCYRHEVALTFSSQTNARIYKPFIFITNSILLSEIFIKINSTCFYYRPVRFPLVATGL